MASPWFVSPLASTPSPSPEVSSITTSGAANILNTDSHQSSQTFPCEKYHKYLQDLREYNKQQRLKGAAPVPVPEADKEAEMPEDENHLDYFLDTFLNEKWGLHYNVIEKYHNEWWFRCSRPGQLSYSLLLRQSFSSIPVDTFDIVSEYLRAIHTPRTCLVDRLIHWKSMKKVHLATVRFWWPRVASTRLWPIYIGSSNISLQRDLKWC